MVKAKARVVGQWEAPRGEGSGFAKREGERGQREVAGLRTGLAERREGFQSEGLPGEFPGAPFLPSAR